MLSPEGRAALVAAIRQNRPWEKSTGPRTEEGKARAAANGLRNRERWRVLEEETEVDDSRTFATRIIVTRKHANGKTTVSSRLLIHIGKLRKKLRATERALFGKVSK